MNHSIIEILTLLTQIGLGTGAIATLRRRMDATDRRVDRHEERLDGHDDAIMHLAVRREP